MTTILSGLYFSSEVCTQIPITSQWYVPVPFFFKSRRWAHTPEKGTWLWTLQICIKKTWCPSQWYAPILDGHLSWDSPQMSENPHPALRFLSSGMIVLRVFFWGCDLFAWNTRSHLGPSAFPWISTTHHTTKLGQNQANPETRRLLNC